MVYPGLNLQSTLIGSMSDLLDENEGRGLDSVSLLAWTYYIEL